MDIVSKLEKRFGGWAIPNLSMYLVGAQAIGFILLVGGYIDYKDMVLVGGLVQVGQWTRLVSFLMIPETDSLFWIFFALYIFYLMGSTLERQWGAFRFNLFILTGYLLTVAAAFIAPEYAIPNMYFLGGVFLAFATLMPEFEFRLFFILPVKVKWLGWLTAAMYIYTLVAGNAGYRLAVLATFATYSLYFGKGFLQNLKAAQRRQAYVKQTAVDESVPFHVCSSCGVSDRNGKNVEFRYCSTCGECFCGEHIRDHGH